MADMLMILLQPIMRCSRRKCRNYFRFTLNSSNMPSMLSIDLFLPIHMISNNSSLVNLILVLLSLSQSRLMCMHLGQDQRVPVGRLRFFHHQQFLRKLALPTM